MMIIHRLDDHQYSFINELIQNVKADLVALTEHAPVDQLINAIFKNTLEILKKAKSRD
jgi:hypothetical protein